MNQDALVAVAIVVDRMPPARGKTPSGPTGSQWQPAERCRMVVARPATVHGKIKRTMAVYGTTIHEGRIVLGPADGVGIDQDSVLVSYVSDKNMRVHPRGLDAPLLREIDGALSKTLDGHFFLNPPLPVFYVPVLPLDMGDVDLEFVDRTLHKVATGRDFLPGERAPASGRLSIEKGAVVIEDARPVRIPIPAGAKVVVDSGQKVHWGQPIMHLVPRGAGVRRERLHPDTQARVVREVIEGASAGHFVDRLRQRFGSLKLTPPQEGLCVDARVLKRLPADAKPFTFASRVEETGTWSRPLYTVFRMPLDRLQGRAGAVCYDLLRMPADQHPDLAHETLKTLVEV